MNSNNKKSKTGRSGFLAVKLTDEALSYQLENYNQLSGLKSMRGKASLVYTVLYFLSWILFIGQNPSTSKVLGYALLALGLVIAVVIYKWTRGGVIIAFSIVLLNMVLVGLINPIQLIGGLIALYLLAYFLYPAYQIEKYRALATSTKLAEPKKSKRKWVGIILVIIILLIVVGVLYALSVSDSNKASAPLTQNSNYSVPSGNLYKNEGYHFSIEFPEGWKIESGDDSDVLKQAVWGSNVISITTHEAPADFKDDSATIKDVVSLVEYKDSLLGGIQEKFPDAKLLDYGELKLDNEPAYWIKYTAPYTTLDTTVQSTSMKYQLIKNKISYLITYSSTTDEFSSIEPKFIKSISTFAIEDY
jgi:hypothetical protein